MVPSTRARQLVEELGHVVCARAPVRPGRRERGPRRFVIRRDKVTCGYCTQSTHAPNLPTHYQRARTRTHINRSVARRGGVIGAYAPGAIPARARKRKICSLIVISYYL
jgi:hypothetical protein